MLSLLHKKAYQQFMTLLNDLPKILEDRGKIPEIKQQFSDLQQYFQQDIMTLTDEGLDIEVIYLWRSLQTEIQREFRLLSTDMLFLATSRQASTRESRLQIIRDRITKLIAYCQKMLTSSS